MSDRTHRRRRYLRLIIEDGLRLILLLTLELGFLEGVLVRICWRLDVEVSLDRFSKNDFLFVVDFLAKDIQLLLLSRIMLIILI